MSRTWKQLGHTEALSGLYFKAARKRRISGSTLPSEGLRCTLAVDARQLDAYCKLCHFGDERRLPATFPHVMAFALQMQLLTRAEFPFPLLGLVHLGNAIRVVRPLGGVSQLQFSVWVEHLQPHEKGATFDLVTEAADGLGVIWAERSRMLCRGVKLEGDAIPVEDAEVPVLSELTRWYADSDIGRRYARVCGDYNPIHLSGVSARLFGFPQAIAHGMWSKAMAVAALRGHLPVSGYEVAVEFRKPVRLPSEVILECSAVADRGRLRLYGQGGIEHMVGEWKVI